MSSSDVSAPHLRDALPEIPWRESDAAHWIRMPWTKLEQYYQQLSLASLVGAEARGAWPIWQALRLDPRSREAHRFTQVLIDEALDTDQGLDELLFRVHAVVDTLLRALPLVTQSESPAMSQQSRLVMRRAACLTTAIALLYHEHSAWRDPVTPCGNRWAIKQRLRELIREAQPFRLDFIDVDHFKEVNDRWGHWVGDSVLLALVHAWQNRLPPCSWLGRWGGDEFLLLTSSEGLNYPISLMLCQPVTVLSDGHRQITVHASVGTSEYPRDGQTVAALMQRADERLYAAKRQRGTPWSPSPGDSAKEEMP
jgi:diguanylate cyclase (GGDEF)-like protein